MKYVVPLFAIIVTFVSCQTNQPTNLTDDALVNRVFSTDEDPVISRLFSPSEVNGLQQILEFFDSHVIKVTGNQKLNEAYESFIFNASDVSDAEEHITETGLKQEQLEDLISELKPGSCFDEIWQFDYGFDHKTMDTLSVFLGFNFDGGYMKLLSTLSQNDPNLNEYLERVNLTGFVTPTLKAGFHELTDHFNFNDPKYRLISAVHYISVVYEKDFNP